MFFELAEPPAELDSGRADPTGLDAGWLDPRFEDRLRQAAAQADRTGEGVAVHVLKVDLPAEESGIARVARGLATLVRESDSWTELEPGRFAILQRIVRKAEGALFLARRLVATATAPLRQGARERRPRVTIGLCFHAWGAKPLELLARAESARRQARIDGSQVRCWQSAALDGASGFLLHDELAKALEHRELFLEFQPQIDLTTGRPGAFEALVRWRHPRLGVIGPGAFIPLAEDGGLIFELGQWVLEHACRRCRAWNAERSSNTPVAVNVSASQLLDEGFPSRVDRILARSSLPADLLELELTETVSAHGPAAAATLEVLKALGVRLALDDVGTGYNSLSNLAELPFDKVKTPKEFTRVTHEGGRLPLIEAVTLLCQRLGLEVVAEGIETEEQLRSVRSAGCHLAQGFLWGLPTADAGSIANVSVAV